MSLNVITYLKFTEHTFSGVNWKLPDVENNVKKWKSQHIFLSMTHFLLSTSSPRCYNWQRILVSPGFWRNEDRTRVPHHVQRHWGEHLWSEPLEDGYLRQSIRRRLRSKTRLRTSTSRWSTSFNNFRCWKVRPPSSKPLYISITHWRSRHFNIQYFTARIWDYVLNDETCYCFHNIIIAFCKVLLLLMSWP